ncbi:BLUF domain-containing protein [Paracoccus aurantiacus]|uniref:BLUF domain-containing protein n=1 Tax=Paracoccus aurantiacus TaxID=2599412 RepID=A0A5C6SAP9_9RHOB|nr:BLUF domain-containing protein [Paracoccus aurantiacus]TXB70685.1 BLUF domain-containing protein [Paracoccus aurantiacus]
MTISHVLYRSNGNTESFDRDCEEILRVARVRNTQAGLTGFLHAEDGVFVQWLEGPEEEIGPVVKSIMDDSRHRDITIYGEGEIDARKFPNWTMGFSSGRQAPLFDWLAEKGAPSHDLRGFGLSLQQFLLLRAA